MALDTVPLVVIPTDMCKQTCVRMGMRMSDKRGRSVLFLWVKLGEIG